MTPMIRRAVIPAAGLGSRLLPLARQGHITYLDQYGPYGNGTPVLNAGQPVGERLGSLLLRQAGPEDGDQRGAGRLVLAEGEEGPGDPRPAIPQPGLRLLVRTGVEAEGHVDPGGNGFLEEAVLTVEEVVDQCRVHLRLPSDCAHRRARIALGGEEFECGREDLSPGTALSRTSAAAP
ncbi:hypothetical protein OG562_38605 [Streptomyces sp. NBC_01275]|nr:hypothetical protein [Streptomyces sp. NBC_01275]MCX4766777.1 hypothetical protein [Streptomyces sp. NBC_01275]